MSAASPAPAGPTNTGSPSAGSPGAGPNPYRLARHAVPSRYELTLSPDLRQRDFVGQVVIHLDLGQPTAELVCNAIELEIDKAWLVGADGIPNDAAAAVDNEAERVTFTLRRTAAAGPAKLHVQYHAKLNDRLAGFYASTYTADDGTERVIATTQCQSTDARRMFPCWDEPDFKAVFSITLLVEKGLTAVSNAPIVAETVMGSGKRMVRFADTMKMSSYLVCVIVGELEASETVDVDGVPLRVLCVPGKSHLAPFALEIGAFSLRYFTEYYGIRYPEKKLDLIAVPDFAAGAMENVGAVTFRETLLLADEHRAPRADLERIADVVSHEVAHMWFGDLVTMSWWNGIWLNEAFATFMEVSCVDAFRPDWNKWTSFSLYRAAAFAVDGLHSTRPIEYPVVSPTDAEGMFDVLTYEKGAAVLRMLEQYLGPEVFRDGVRRYLQAHSYANTETADLWDAIESAAAGEPVRQLMDGWILQGGHPLVAAARDDSGNATVVLQQTRFSYLPDAPAATWDVPVLYRSGRQTGRILLGAEPVQVAVDDGPVVVNAGSHGFYRTRYDAGLLRSLVDALRLDLDTLQEAERFTLVSDTWAAVLAGNTPVTDYLTLSEVFAGERSPEVWRGLLVGLRAIDAVLDGQAREALREKVRAFAGPALAALGWTKQPGDGALRCELRGVLIETLGVLGNDIAVQRQAAALLDAALRTDGGVDPDVCAAVVTVSAATGDAALFERYVQARRAATTPQDGLRLMYALGAFQEPSLVDRALSMSMTDEVRSQDAPYLLRNMLGGRDQAIATWRFLRDSWERVTVHVPSNSVARMLEGLAMLALVDDAAAAEAEAFFAAGAGHDVPQGQKQLTQSLERLRVNRAWRGRERDALVAALAPPPAGPADPISSS